MATRILLLDDVDNVGVKGEIVSVKPGYAFNFLIPKRLALVADVNAIRRQARLKEERRLKAAEDKKQADHLASQLNGQTFAFVVKVDHEGHMYGSVSALDIVNMIKAQVNIELEKRFVQLKHPIKQVGAYEIPLRLKEGVEALIHVKVASEHAPEHAQEG